MSLGIDNDKRLYAVIVQKLNQAVIKFITEILARIKSRGHIVVNNNCTFRAIIQNTMVTLSMQRTVFVLAIQFLTVNNLVTTILGFCEFFSLSRYKNNVFAMDISVHVRIEELQQIFASTTRGLPTNKSIRNKNSLNMAIYKSVDSKRNFGMLQFIPNPLRNLFFTSIRHNHTPPQRRILHSITVQNHSPPYVPLKVKNNLYLLK